MTKSSLRRKFSQFIGSGYKLKVTVAFGRVLRRLRQERGLSQETVGELANLQRKYISLLERADYQPKLDTVFRLAKALEYSPSNLIALVEEEASKDL